MSLLLSANKIQKTVGSKQLFDDLSLGIYANEKIGLIGPNGSGKSTLLKIFSAEDTADEGEISFRKNLNVAVVHQDTHFQGDISAQQFIVDDMLKKGLDELEAEVAAAMSLSLAGFLDTEVQVSDLSGGWKKRLAIARAMAYDPELLILDEPTNHMDWDGIFWLESWLKSFKNTFIVVSHDREFLNQVTNRTIEINPLYQSGYLSFNCSYQKFLDEKDKYIQAQMTLQESLSNKARREVEWLRAGVKARTTKSQSRINEAHNLLEHLGNVKDRNRSATIKTRLEIDSTERRTKKLIEFKKLSVGYSPDAPLIKDLEMILGPKSCIGLLGDNGSGKSTLLKAVMNDDAILSGEIFKADDLKIVYFDQRREQLPQDINLIQFLGDGSDYMIFKGQSVHVAAYASRFLFASDKMQLKISQLSGGEQARLLIAKLLLNPADVLILDEPTNDLDIETIQILEETISQFEGLAILVSHDRTFLSELCEKFLAIQGDGNWATYAAVDQWIKVRKKKDEGRSRSKGSSSGAKPTEALEALEAEPLKSKAKLSYKEKQALQTIESDIAKAEKELELITAKLSDPSVIEDRQKFIDTSKDVQKLQDRVDQLYAFWEDLESRS